MRSLKTGILFLLLFLAGNPIAWSQTLIINEVSNGPSGNMEYAEFVVIDTAITYDCNSNTPPCIDIRGWIFDDNSGYHGATGVAAGAIRFAYDPLWSCVPVGTIIVIFNNSDPNTSMPPVDVSLNDGNCVIVAPVVSNYFDRNPTTPGALACSYPASGWVSSGDWTTTALANSGDCARVVDLSGCEVFSLCYASASSNTLIYFNSGGSGSDNVWYFTSGDPYLQANWVEACADPTTCGSNDQTPGAPNNAANAAYIGQFNNNCLPIAPLTANATVLNSACGCNATVSVTASGSIGPYTYSWFDQNFNSINQNTATASNLCPGTYNVIIESSIQCSDTLQVSVVSPVVIDPQLNVTASSCAGTADGSASVNPIGGIAPYSISWSPAPGSGQGTATAGGLAPGQYSLSITDAAGCQINEVFQVNSPAPLLLPALSQTSPTCNGSCNATLNANPSGGTGAYNYVWSNGSSASGLTQLCAGNYSVTVSDANGCSATASAAIADPSVIVLDLVFTNAACGQNNGSATANVSGGTVSGAYSYIWFDAAFNLLPSTATINNLAPGDYTVVVGDDNGCSASGMVSILQPGSPVLSETHNNLLCAGDGSGNIDLSITGIPPYSISWTGPNGFVSSSEDPASLQAGIYTVSVTDSGTCSASISVTLTEPSAIILSAGSDQLLCAGETVSFTATASGGSLPFTYNWGNGNNSPSLTFVATADTTVCVSLTDNNGCVALQDCAVLSLHPALLLTVSNDTLVCPGSSLTLLAALSGGSGAPFTMQWENDGTLLSVNSSLPIQPTQNENYIFTASDFCTSISDTISINILPTPVPAIAADITSGCAPLTVEFNELTSLSGGDCEWIFGNAGANDDCTNTSFTFTQAGCYDVSYSLINPNGCSTSVSQSQMICVVADPIAGFSLSTESVSSINNTIDLNNTSAGADTYIWTLNGELFSQQTHPTVTVPTESASEYELCLIATNSSSCSDTTCSIIEVVPDLAVYVPNAFTPNADAANNAFGPVVSGIADEYHFMIFDRWGNLIFESFTPGELWDGTYKGLPSQIDTYVWTLMLFVDHPGKEYLYKGHVTLFR